MRKIGKCDSCGRRPSERIGVNPSERLGPHAVNFPSLPCPDPIHDLADRAPQLQAELEELAAILDMERECFNLVAMGFCSVSWNGKEPRFKITEKGRAHSAAKDAASE